jgi:transposase InsO family protein
MRLARAYGRYGYRRITALLRGEGWRVNHKRVERIWRREGLKVPSKQPKRGRLWFNDGSCIRMRPCWPHHVWSYDFVATRTHDGRPIRMLTVIDEYTRECLAHPTLSAPSQRRWAVLLIGFAHRRWPQTHSSR